MANQSEIGFKFEVSGRSFDVVRFELSEGISQPFRLELELSSFDDAVDATELLDREARFTIERDGTVERTVLGLLTAFGASETGFHRTRFVAVVESPLARLALRHNCRIFQQINAPDVLATLLKDHRLSARTAYSGNHEVREYCVQYRQSDATFLHQLATEEGIVHWVDPRDGQGTLVFSDRVESAPVLDGEVFYQPAPAGDAPAPHLWRFAYRRQLAPTRIIQREYSFHNPQYDQQHEARARAVEQAVGDYEHYSYAGRYKRDEVGKPFTRTKLSGLRNLAEHASIEGDDARLWPGLAFDLTGHPNEQLNARYRVITMHHRGEQATSQEHDAAGAEHGSRYSFEATVVPAHYDWKPEPAPRPVIDGPQVAHVVGPPNEEIHCDIHGRAENANSRQAGMYLGAALAGAVSALAAGAGGTAIASTLSGGGGAVAVPGLTSAGWAVIALIAIGVGIAFALGADNANHGPVEIWLKHSAWGVHSKHYTLPRELDAFHGRLHRPRLNVQWEDGRNDIGLLTIHCTLPSSMRGERFAHSLRVTLEGRPLGVVEGPIMYATGTKPVDYRKQCLITRHGARGGFGAERGWTISMHEDAVVDLEYLYQPNPEEQPDLGFTQPDFPQPLRITSGGWFSDPLDSDKAAPVKAPA